MFAIDSLKVVALVPATQPALEPHLTPAPVPPADLLATVLEMPAEEPVATLSAPAALAEPVAPGSVKITSTPTGAASCAVAL